MKIKNLILFTAVLLTAPGLISCKKDNSSSGNDEIETTFEISGNDAVTENMAGDAGDVLVETAIDSHFSGRNSGTAATQTMNNLSCATVTITPSQGFPKNMTIDFGAGCTSPNGITRKGKIKLGVSDSLRKSGSVSIMNFENYYVDGIKIEGMLTWTNTSQAALKSWQRKWVNGKITAIGGRYWLHSGIKNILQTEGVNTPFNLVDDIYSITGIDTITNAKGVTGTSTVIIPLQLKVSCGNVEKGTVKFEAPNHTALVNFGDETCDRLATISIDGRDPQTILLR